MEELRKKLIEMDNIRESVSHVNGEKNELSFQLNNEMKTLSKELAKMRSQLTTKDSELEKEKKLVEGLNK